MHLNDWFGWRFQARNRGKTNRLNYGYLFIMNGIEQTHAKRTNKREMKQYPETSIAIESLDVFDKKKKSRGVAPALSKPPSPIFFQWARL